MKQSKSAYDRVTERIIDLLEQGVCPWRRPWQTLNIRPQNFSSGHEYSGVNLFLLNAMGFQAPLFMTFKQVRDKGGQIIKGSKGFPVVYWGTIRVEDEHAKSEKNRTKEIPFLKHFTVFNAAQIEGIDFPTPEPPNQTEFQPILAADQIVTQWEDRPEIREDRGRACYNPLIDVVEMPNRSSFISPQEYYSTLFHELGHSTGAKHRLARKFGKRFGDNHYSREELIAEMTSAFLCAECGIDNSVIDNQATYLSGWIKTLKGDSKLVVIAASAAQKAANLILGNVETESKAA
ncbi:ArdC family protein [Cerasicoccus frondis]|uniref:ArdC family protein n=1 Tax=Cerasicoccus frondis TaxID=490090 RepID=UPI00285292FE|nr:zincin-like metallopeptidase domain-containing protein [Cerasicoccus frondis]